VQIFYTDHHKSCLLLMFIYIYISNYLILPTILDVQSILIILTVVKV
jgi:hypothetical protein